MLLPSGIIKTKAMVALSHYNNIIKEAKKDKLALMEEIKTEYENLGFWKKLFYEDDFITIAFKTYKFDHKIEKTENIIDGLNGLIDRIEFARECGEDKIEVSDKLVNILTI